MCITEGDSFADEIISEISGQHIRRKGGSAAIGVNAKCRDYAGCNADDANHSVVSVEEMLFVLLNGETMYGEKQKGERGKRLGRGKDKEGEKRREEDRWRRIEEGG